MAFQAVFPRVMHLAFGPGLETSTAVSWWQVTGKTCVAAYQPLGAASLDASYINLVNPGTYDAAPGVAPTLDANGWVFNGSSQYLTTGIDPAQDQSWSALVRFSGATRGVICTPLGQQGFTGNNSFSLDLRFADQMQFRNGATLITSQTANAGVMGMAGATAYLNAISQGTITAGTADIVYGLYIGAQNYTNSPNRYYAGNIQALVIYSAALTAGEVAAVSAAMAALTG